MRTINGYVIVGHLKDMEVDNVIIFGPKTSSYQGGYHDGSENFCSNGLVPFSNLKTARIAFGSIWDRSSFDNFWIAKLKMNIAETEEDLQRSLFTRSKSLIAIGEGYDHYILMGGTVDKKPHLGFIPGTLLLYNGLITINNYHSALFIANEIKRQGHMPAQIATFSLKPLQPPK